MSAPSCPPLREGSSLALLVSLRVCFFETRTAVGRCMEEGVGEDFSFPPWLSTPTGLSPWPSPSADFTWRKTSAAKGAFSIAGVCKDEQAERGGKRRHMPKGQRAMIAAKIRSLNERSANQRQTQGRPTSLRRLNEAKVANLGNFICAIKPLFERKQITRPCTVQARKAKAAASPQRTG